MGRPPEPINVVPFSSVWKRIKSYHDGEYRASLRVAANLIGFYRFPIGWAWDEYPLDADNRSDRPLEYQEEAQAAQATKRKSGLSDAGDPKAKSLAASYRRKVVEDKLMSIIYRNQVGIFQGGLSEPRALIEFGKTERDLDDKDRRVIRVQTSEVGARLWTRRRCWIDATDLISLLLESVEQRGTDERYDWLAVEAYCRQQIETDGVKGTSAELISATQDWWGLEHLDQELPTKRLGQLIMDLKAEYSGVKKTGFIPL